MFRTATEHCFYVRYHILTMIEINKDWRKLLDIVDANTLLLVNAAELKSLCEGWQEKYNALQKKLDSMKEPEYLTVNQVTEKLHVSKSTLWRWSKDGYLVAKKVGNRTLYSTDDVNAVINATLVDKTTNK